MQVNQSDPLLKCPYLVSYDSSEINLFKRIGASSFSLTLNVPCDETKCFSKLVNILNDLPINSAVCVILGKTMSRIRELRKTGDTSVILDGNKNFSVILNDKCNNNGVKFDIEKSDISKLISKLNETSLNLKISIMLRSPSPGFPYSIYTELNSGKTHGGRLASRIVCHRNDGILMFYSKGIIGSGLEKSEYIPLEILNGSLFKYKVISSVEKFKTISRKFAAPIFLNANADFLDSKANSYSENLTSKIRNFKSVAQIKVRKFLPSLKEYLYDRLMKKDACPPVDVIVVCDPSAQTACCTAMTIDKSFNADLIIELGAFREKMRSNFFLYCGSAVVVETNNLPLTMDDAHSTVGHLIEKNISSSKLTLVVGDELLRNDSFGNLITALFIKFKIRSISFFGHDSILVDDETMGLMKNKSDRITFVICGKKERLSSIQAFHKGVRVIELPNINVANITESDRELIRVDIFS